MPAPDLPSNTTSEFASAEGVRQSAPIDLRRVRRLFAIPARIRESDFLRREISARMFERLDLVKLAPRVVLDAGCGEGADLSLLLQRYPEAMILGQDASAAMLRCAAGHQRAARSGLDRLLGFLPGRRATQGPAMLAGDFAQLPFKLQGLDLVWSNLALHWHPQPNRVFAEWRRALSVNGLLMFSCFGPDTFLQIRQAYAAAGLHDVTLPFVDMHDFGDMLVEAGFSTPVMDMEKITVTYSSVEKLLQDLRAWGGNPLTTHSRGLRGRATMAKMRAALEAMRGKDDKIPLSFEVIYGHAFRPAPKKTAAGDAIIRFGLPKK